MSSFIASWVMPRAERSVSGDTVTTRTRPTFIPDLQAGTARWYHLHMDPQRRPCSITRKRAELLDPFDLGFRSTVKLGDELIGFVAQAAFGHLKRPRHFSTKRQGTSRLARRAAPLMRSRERRSGTELSSRMGSYQMI
jgi:hypothetical protein